MSSLTDRYAWAVVRLLPEAQRDEIDRELHELVAEMTDGRLAAAGTPGTPDPLDAERAALTELGDPTRLAARYVERPRSLVGPELFPEYVRVLKLVWIIAVPLVVALAVFGALLDDDPTALQVLGSAAAALYGGTVMVAFWVTLVYAFPDKWKYAKRWTPDDLPDLPAAATTRGLSIGDAAFSLVVTVLTATALVWQQVWPPLDNADGEGVPVLDPDIWNGAAQVLLALLGVSFVVILVVVARRRWTYGLAAVNGIVNLVSLVIVAWLALDERFVNDEFLAVLADRADFDTVPTVNPWLVIASIAAIEIWDTVEAFRGARRDERAATGRGRGG